MRCSFAQDPQNFATDLRAHPDYLEPFPESARAANPPREFMAWVREGLEERAKDLSECCVGDPSPRGQDWAAVDILRIIRRQRLPSTPHGLQINADLSSYRRLRWLPGIRP